MDQNGSFPSSPPVPASSKRFGPNMLHLDLSNGVKDTFEQHAFASLPPTNERSLYESNDDLAVPIPTPMTPPALDIALSALQYLPLPVIVLDSTKTVILSNEAMGRLCCASPTFNKGQAEQDHTSIAQSLKGQTLSQIGVDMIHKDGNPIWVNWEEYLDTIGESESAYGKHSLKDDGEYNVQTPTALGPEPPSKLTSTNLNRTTVHDVSVDVLLSPVRCMTFGSRTEESERSSRSSSQIAASMIISVWTLDEAKYFTLTFTSSTAQSPRASSPISTSRTVTKAARFTSSHSPSSTASSISSRRLQADSTSSSTVSSPSSTSTNFLPNGPPSKTNISSTPSVLQKATRLREALLNCMNLPCYALWHDFSVAIPNQALMKLLPEQQDETTETTLDFILQFKVWKEDFSRQLEPDEYPILQLLKTQKPFHNRRIGLTHPKTGKLMVYDTNGECIWDQNGEFQGGVVILKDVTEYLDRIQAQKEKTAQQFEMIANMVPQMVWTTTPSGYHDWFSQRWYDYTGLTEEESVGEGWRLPFHPDDMPVTVPKWKHSLESGEQYVTEYRCRRKDGEWRWMLGQALPLRDEHGAIVRWFGTCTDIHESVVAREVARRNRRQLLQILDTAKITLWAVDMQRTITCLDGSEAWHSDTYSGPHKDLVGRHVHELFMGFRDDRMRRKYKEPVDKILSGKSKEEFWETQIEGSGKWYRNRCLPVHRQAKMNDDQDSAMILDGAVVISVDITELRDRETELMRQEEQNAKLQAKAVAAKAARESAQTWVRNVSHDLRTPIGGVIGMSELLLDSKLDQDQRESVENILRSANGLLTVINDILDLAKVESGRLDIEEVPFSLSVVVDDVYKMLSFAAERKNLAYESFIEPEIAHEFRVMGDPGRLRQVLQNLLTNSIKFTSSGSVKLSASIKSHKQDSITIEFIVEDTGIGIEEEVQKNLFKPFSQADSSTARRYGGTGLGLSISKNLVELMRGKIRLDSRLGTGTKVIFSIPFKRSSFAQSSPIVELNPLSDRLRSDLSISCGSSEQGATPKTPTALQKSPPNSAGATSQTAHESLSGKQDLSEAERKNVHVLVVEDNPVNQQIALKTIKKLNFSVSACWNGQEAIDYLHQVSSAKNPAPHLILMDCQMPVVDGYRATQLIRESKDIAELRAVPIVAMTASAIQGDKEKCEEAGMDDYVAKPVRRKALENMIVKWALKTLESRGFENTPEDFKSSDPPALAKELNENEDPSPVSNQSLFPNPESPTSMKEENLSQGEKTGPSKPNVSEGINLLPPVEAGDEAISLRDDKLMGMAQDPRLEQQVHAKGEWVFAGDGPSHALTTENIDKFVGQQELVKQLSLSKDMNDTASKTSLAVEARQSMDSTRTGGVETNIQKPVRPSLLGIPKTDSDKTITGANKQQ